MSAVEEEIIFYEKNEKDKDSSNKNKRENFDNPEEYWDLLNAAKKKYHNALAISKGQEPLYTLTQDEIKLLHTKITPFINQDTALYNIKNDIVREVVDMLLTKYDANNKDYKVKRIEFLKYITELSISKKTYRTYLDSIKNKEKVLSNHLKRFNEEKLKRPNIEFKAITPPVSGFNSLPDDVKDNYVKSMYKVILFRFYCLIREDLLRTVKRDYFDSDILKIGRYNDLLRYYQTDKYTPALKAYILKVIVPQKTFEIISTFIKDTIEATEPVINNYNPDIKENYMTEIYIAHNKNYEGAVSSLTIEMFSKLADSYKKLIEEKEAAEEAKKNKKQ